MLDSLLRLLPINNLKREILVYILLKIVVQDLYGRFVSSLLPSSMSPATLRVLVST